VKSFVGFVCSVALVIVVAYGSFAYVWHSTVLDTAWLDREVERVDPNRVVKSVLIEKLPADVGDGLTPVIDTALEEQGPWLLGQVQAAARQFQAHFRGDLDRIQVSIDPAPIRESILKQMASTLRTSPVSVIRRLPPTEQQQFEAAARQATSEAFDRIETFSFDSLSLMPEGERGLRDARQFLLFFRRYSLPLLVGVGVGLAVLATIVGQLRQVAFALLASGAILFLPYLFASEAVRQLPIPALSTLPAAVVAYLPNISEHLMEPLELIAYGCLGAGLVLLIVSLVMPGRRRWEERY
jgi:hypothetical protein